MPDPLDSNIDWRLVTDKYAIPTAKELSQKVGPITLRTVHYNLVTREIVPNTRNTYTKLSKYLVKARKEGHLRWDTIVDDTRRSIADFYDYYISPDDYLHHLILQLDSLHDNYQNKILYRWYKQPCYVEVWLEKNALVRVFRNFLEGRHVRLVPNRGYGSWAYAYENFKRLRDMMYEKDRKIEIGKSKDDITVEDNSIVKEIHILYFGDYDPSGVDMDSFIQDKQIAYFVKRFRLRNVHFHRIAITKEQIEEFELPSKPEDAQTLSKLGRDSRTNSFKLKHEGELYAVELDALLAKRPDEFKKLVQDAVDEYYEPDIFEELVSRPQHSKEVIRRLVIVKVKTWLKEVERGNDNDNAAPH